MALWVENHCDILILYPSSRGTLRDAVSLPVKPSTLRYYQDIFI